MSKIMIGSMLIENADLHAPTQSNPNVLGVKFITDKTLDELTVVFKAENATEIRVLGNDGNPVKIYFNEKLSSLQMESVGLKRSVSAAFLVSVKPEGEDDKYVRIMEELAALKAENEELKRALTAIEEGITNA